MKIRFWGTRGSIAKPGAQTLRYGGNTSCVELRSNAGTLVIIDCGTGIQALGQELMQSGPKPVRGSILISHTHWDHIQGFPFFAPLFVPGNQWDIYGPRGLGQSLRDALAGQMQYTYFPVSLDALGCTVRFHDLVEGVFHIDDMVVRTRYLNHPALTLAYRVEADGASMVYACDHEPFQQQSADGVFPLGEQDRRHAQFVQDADLVIHDAQYTLPEYRSRTGWGHSTVEYAVQVCRQAGAKRLALTHHDPLRSDAELERIEADAIEKFADEELELFAAAEGMVLDLNASAAAASSHDEFPADTAISPAIWEHSVLVCAADDELLEKISQAARLERVQLILAGSPEAAANLLRGADPSLVFLDEAFAADGAIAEAIASKKNGGANDFPVLAAAPSQMEELNHVTDWLIGPFSIQYLRTRIRASVLRNTCRWMRAPLPADEEGRLAALTDLGILDTPFEDRFDRITRLAANLFNVPFALVSLVDHDRQWLKASHGFELENAHRDVSFCSHAILNSHVMVVPDTLLDDRFADHPSVVERPRIRFYAGYPLRTAEAYRVGTLCILDTKPREFDEFNVTLLRDLGQLVEQEFGS